MKKALSPACAGDLLPPELRAEGEPLMVALDPTICCTDLWPPDSLTEIKLAAYKVLIARGDVKVRRVTYHKASGYTTVEYWSSLPHAWILDQLRELAATLDPGEQIRLEGLL